MRALTVVPSEAGSAQLEDIDEPPTDRDLLEVETLLVGVCGTDAEIVGGGYGKAPEGQERLVIGHEALGRVVRAPAQADLAPGDLVVPIVRRPDPVPCSSCAAGEWDMCTNGLYVEHGIKGAHGFARERFTLDPRFAVLVPASLGDLAVLTEPASVVAKAWEQIDRIAARTSWKPSTALIVGAGPIGLLAALMATQRGLRTSVLDRVTSGPKPELVDELGATYVTGPISSAGPPPDVIVECTGVGSLVVDAIDRSGSNGIVCLTGLSSGAHTLTLDPDRLNRRLVLENNVVFGTVNANQRHYERAIADLAAADPVWLGSLLTRRVSLENWRTAFERRPMPDNVKSVMQIG